MSSKSAIGSSRKSSFSLVQDGSMFFLIHSPVLKKNFPVTFNRDVNNSIFVIVESISLTVPITCYCLPSRSVAKGEQKYLLVLEDNGIVFAYIVDSFLDTVVIDDSLISKNVQFLTTVYASYPYISIRNRNCYLVNGSV